MSRHMTAAALGLSTLAALIAGLATSPAVMVVGTTAVLLGALTFARSRVSAKAVAIAITVGLVLAAGLVYLLANPVIQGCVALVSPTGDEIGARCSGGPMPSPLHIIAISQSLTTVALTAMIARGRGRPSA